MLYMIDPYDYTQLQDGVDRQQERATDYLKFTESMR